MKIDQHPRRNVVKRNDNIYVRKEIISSPVLSGSKGDRQYKFTISTDDVDTSNDKVDQSGWKLDHFLRNPVVLFNHQDQILPIGKCVWIGLENNRLKAIVEFATAEQNPLADQVYRLVEGGFMSATSVGFSPIEMSETTEQERGADTYEAGIDFKKCELFEFSIVNLPANPYCLIEPGQRSQMGSQMGNQMAQEPSKITHMSSNNLPLLNKTQRALRKRHLALRKLINEDD